MKVKKDCRGFSRIEFTDHYGRSCSLSESSLATDEAIWFGRDEANLSVFTDKGWVPVVLSPDTYVFSRMHLTRKQVKKLLPHLIKFVETGKVK